MGSGKNFQPAYSALICASNGGSFINEDLAVSDYRDLTNPEASIFEMPLQPTRQGAS